MKIVTFIFKFSVQNYLEIMPTWLWQEPLAESRAACAHSDSRLVLSGASIDFI